jgi:hypothetical protein
MIRRRPRKRSPSQLNVRAARSLRRKRPRRAAATPGWPHRSSPPHHARLPPRPDRPSHASWALRHVGVALEDHDGEATRAARHAHGARQTAHEPALVRPRGDDTGPASPVQAGSEGGLTEHAAGSLADRDWWMLTTGMLVAVGVQQLGAAIGRVLVGILP